MGPADCLFPQAQPHRPDAEAAVTPNRSLRNVLMLLAALGLPLGSGYVAGQASGNRQGQSGSQAPSAGKGSQSGADQGDKPKRSQPPSAKPDRRIEIDLDHILEGGINRRGELVGLHHLPSAPRRMKAQGKLCDVYFEYTSPGGPNDVRTARAQLIDPKSGDIILEKFSTLYPESWSVEDIEAAIREAYGDAKGRDAINQDGRWQGKGKGIRIDGYLSNDNRRIATAFPVYQQPRRAPSNRR